MFLARDRLKGRHVPDPEVRSSRRRLPCRTDSGQEPSKGATRNPGGRCSTRANARSGMHGRLNVGDSFQGRPDSPVALPSAAMSNASGPPAPPVGILDNRSRGAAGDFLKAHLKDGTELSVVSAYFTISAYESLKRELENVEQMRFLYGAPQHLRALTRDKRPERAFGLTELGVSSLSWTRRWRSVTQLEHRLKTLTKTLCSLLRSASPNTAKYRSSRPRNRHALSRRAFVTTRRAVTSRSLWHSASHVRAVLSSILPNSWFDRNPYCFPR